MDLRNNRRQTPLHLAVSQGHWSLVELLLNHNGDIKAIDEDGDTVLHIAIDKSRHQPPIVPTPDSSGDCPMVHAVWQDLINANGPTELALSCFLISYDSASGMFLFNAKNTKGKTPFDLLSPEMREGGIGDLLLSYVHFRHRRREMVVTEVGVEVVADVEAETSPGGAADRSDNNSDEQQDLGGFSGHSDDGEVSGVEEATSGVDRADEKTEREKSKDLERLRYLETRVADLEEANMCSICMERRRNVAFLCGHGACEHCSAPLKTCHMCRKTITKKINLY